MRARGTTDDARRREERLAAGARYELRVRVLHEVTVACARDVAPLDELPAAAGVEDDRALRPAQAREAPVVFEHEDLDRFTILD